MAKSKKNLINNDDIIVSDKNVSEINAPIESINEEVDEKENKQQKVVDKIITSSMENTTRLGTNHDFSMSTTLLF